jgi:hypothetical protein
VRAPRFTFAHSLGLSFLGVAALLYFLASAPERALAERESAWGGIREGDVVFQDLACGVRCALIRQATDSRYVHVGIVLVEGGERVVYEAYEPVGPTPLAEWVARGVHGHIAVYRPDAALLADLPAARRGIERMRAAPTTATTSGTTRPSTAASSSSRPSPKRAASSSSRRTP